MLPSQLRKVDAEGLCRRGAIDDTEAGWRLLDLVVAAHLHAGSGAGFRTCRLRGIKGSVMNDFDRARDLAGTVNVWFAALFLYGVAELAWLHFRRRLADVPEYRMMTLGTVVTGIVYALVALVAGPVTSTAGAIWASQFSLWDAGYGPLAWVYGLLVYEGFYWLQHWLGHRVRLLWCIHAPHHVPRSMNIFVGFNHSFLESVFWLPLMTGVPAALLGVHPIVVAGITVIDVVWGNLLHVSDGVLVRRLGPLEWLLQTPSRHRVHHAQNPRYMDTNYNSITLFWDWLAGTLEPLDDAEPVTYGITRAVDTSSFRDVHFGEFESLWRDLRGAASWRGALALALMPPGWSPGGEQHTAAAVKAKWRARQGSGS
jgi:sterol desaturase/sphingolipid hydroxylase (fatty acid hydroxylase superfamily)